MINEFGREPSKPHVESALEFSIPEMPKTFEIFGFTSLFSKKNSTFCFDSKITS